MGHYPIFSIPVCLTLDDPKQEWKSAVFSKYMLKYQNERFMGYSERNNRHRYVEWVNMDTKELVFRELFDQMDDPDENENIADFSENKKLIEQLYLVLKSGWKNALPEHND